MCATSLCSRLSVTWYCALHTSSDAVRMTCQVAPLTAEPPSTRHPVLSTLAVRWWPLCLAAPSTRVQVGAGVVCFRWSHWGIGRVFVLHCRLCAPQPSGWSQPCGGAGAVTTSGRLFTWGWNEHGNLGVCVCVCAGGSVPEPIRESCWLIGKLWGCACAGHGAVLVNTPTPTVVELPRGADGKDRVIVAVAAGGASMLCVTQLKC